VHVNLPFPDKKKTGNINFTAGLLRPPLEDEAIRTARTRAEEMITAEKIRAIKLLLSFVFAVVHHLRNEHGVDFDDYNDILPLDFRAKVGRDNAPLVLLSRYATHAAIDRGRLGHTPSFRKGASVQKSNNSSSPHQDIAPSEVTALLGDDHTTVEFRAHETPASLPLPLIISHELTRVLFKFRRRGYLDVLGPAGFNAMNTCVATMVDQLTALERVATTPIPISYGIHLKQCVSLYLFSLPFTLIQDMHWRMVPLVTLVAFTLMGIEGIADAIEMPFGRGKADLPLENYCIALRSEVEYMIERLPQGPEEDIDPFENEPAGLR